MIGMPVALKPSGKEVSPASAAAFAPSPPPPPVLPAAVSFPPDEHPAMLITIHADNSKANTFFFIEPFPPFYLF